MIPFRRGNKRGVLTSYNQRNDTDLVGDVNPHPQWSLRGACQGSASLCWMGHFAPSLTFCFSNDAVLHQSVATRLQTPSRSTASENFRAGARWLGFLFSLGEQYAISGGIVLEKRTKIRHFLSMPGTIERSYHSLITCSMAARRLARIKDWISPGSVRSLGRGERSAALAAVRAASREARWG